MAVQGDTQVVRKLFGAIRSLEDRTLSSQAQMIPTGWPDVDNRLGGGLACSGLHEFFGPAPDPKASQQPNGSLPLCLLVHLASQSTHRGMAPGGANGKVVWIGSRVWPNPQFLQCKGLLERSLFVDAADPATRLWAIELALRCPAVVAVVGDGSKFSIASTRRLELAARSGQALVLLARPGNETALPSAASTRWSVARRTQAGLADDARPSLHRCTAEGGCATRSATPAWTLELLRCKGRGPSSPIAEDGDRNLAQPQHIAVGNPMQPAQTLWPLEWDYAKNSVVISAAVVDQRAATPPAPAQRRLVG